MLRTLLGLLTSIFFLTTLQLYSAPVLANEVPQVLAFSKTEGYRHGSISDALTAIETLGDDNGFSVTKTEDASVFTQANLSNYAAVIFVMTTGDVLNASQQSAFEGYIQAGGGYVGIHSASDTEYDWP